MKLSRWRSSNIKPVYIGPYRVKCGDVECQQCHKEQYFSYWDGHHFNGMWISISRAIDNKYHGDDGDVEKWRGVVK